MSDRSEQDLKQHLTEPIEMITIRPPNTPLTSRGLEPAAQSMHTQLMEPSIGTKIKRALVFDANNRHLGILVLICGLITLTLVPIDILLAAFGTTLSTPLGSALIPILLSLVIFSWGALIGGGLWLVLHEMRTPLQSDEAIQYLVGTGPDKRVMDAYRTTADDTYLTDAVNDVYDGYCELQRTSRSLADVMGVTAEDIADGSVHCIQGCITETAADDILSRGPTTAELLNNSESNLYGERVLPSIQHSDTPSVLVVTATPRMDHSDLLDTITTQLNPNGDSEDLSSSSDKARGIMQTNGSYLWDINIDLIYLENGEAESAQKMLSDGIETSLNTLTTDQVGCDTTVYSSDSVSARLSEYTREQSETLHWISSLIVGDTPRDRIDKITSLDTAWTSPFAVAGFFGGRDRANIVVDHTQIWSYLLVGAQGHPENRGDRDTVPKEHTQTNQIDPEQKNSIEQDSKEWWEDVE